jgi:Tfp pilus assembly protein PilX
MSWIISHWDAIVGAAGALYGLVHRTKSARAAKAQAAAEAAARAAKVQLEAILADAHRAGVILANASTATWEETLVTDARAARALGKTPPPGWPTGQ